MTIWLALHGRPVVQQGVIVGLSEILRETRYFAYDQEEAVKVCDAIAAEVLAERGPPVAAALDTEENWKK